MCNMMTSNEGGFHSDKHQATQSGTFILVIVEKRDKLRSDFEGEVTVGHGFGEE